MREEDAQTPKPKILAFATQGSGGDDEARLAALLSRLEPTLLLFASKGARSKIRSFTSILKTIAMARPDLVVMEGSGIAGGTALILARLLLGAPYVISSGDAIAPFVASKARWAAPLFSLYEKALCRLSAGFIGWTPYLVGRALTYGAPRAMTAPGWAPSRLSSDERRAARARLRKELAIPEDAIVVGIAGSLAWNPRIGYCYGYEIVQAMRLTKRRDVHALIVGNGSGKAELEGIAGDLSPSRIHFTGRVPRAQVPEYLSCMDAGVLPQSCDGVGSFRYTTKISEYLASGIPVVTGEIPLSYDLDEGWIWRLPGDAPWDEIQIRAFAAWMEGLTREELERKQRAVPSYDPTFDRERQIKQVTEFVRALIT